MSTDLVLSERDGDEEQRIESAGGGGEQERGNSRE
jgi:hypothetical protein